MPISAASFRPSPYELNPFSDPDSSDFSRHSSLKHRLREPSQAFSNLFNAYTKAINKSYGRTGSLFEHPFGRIEVTDAAHFRRLIAYIHQNPHKHGFVDDFRAWKYSSYHALTTTSATHLNRGTVLTWFGSLDALVVAHDQDVLDADIAPLAPQDFD